MSDQSKIRRGEPKPSAEATQDTSEWTQLSDEREKYKRSQERVKLYFDLLASEREEK